MPSDNPYSPFDHPERIAEIWVEAWNRRDADRLAELFVEDADFVNVTGLWWHDREAIRRAHDYGLRTIFEQSTIALVERRVRWLVSGPDATPAAAVVHAKMPAPAARSLPSWSAGPRTAGAAQRPRTPTWCRARRPT